MHKNIPIVVGITFLFLGTCITPTVANDNVKKQSIPISNGNILYVGGNGPDNYTKIQDAIDDASDGDMVFVYDDSSPYLENVVVNKSISLIGENRDNTIIDASESRNVIEVVANTVKISGFTVKNGGHFGIDIVSSKHIILINNNICSNSYGIRLYSYCNNNTIVGNNISNNHHYYGLALASHCNYNRISNNTISNNNQNGIHIDYSSDSNLISDNVIYSNGWHGIISSGSSNNVISDNKISVNGKDGVQLYLHCSNNIISGNSILKNRIGIALVGYSDNNFIYHNNLINNYENGYDECNNIWDDGKFGNYWNDYKLKYPFARKIRSKGIWDKPYEIPGGNNIDNYPLIKQWPDPRGRTTPRFKTTEHPILHWFLERFPLLEKLLGLFR